jgi:hypothetical protein
LAIGGRGGRATGSFLHASHDDLVLLAPQFEENFLRFHQVEARSEGFIADYLSADEQALVARTSPAERSALVTLFWSAKESALKALRTGLRLDTRCVTVELHDSAQPAEEGPSLKNTSFDSRLIIGDRCWRTLQVRDPQGEIFMVGGKWTEPPCCEPWLPRQQRTNQSC